MGHSIQFARLVSQQSQRLKMKQNFGPVNGHTSATLFWSIDSVPWLG
jgi:hypothetical protein